MRFKKGQIVRCKPGFKACDEEYSITNHGGFGYRDGKTFVIERVTCVDSSIGNIVYWPVGEEAGVYGQALELAGDASKWYGSLLKFNFV